MSHEITQTDGIAYVGKEPWHGIGVKVDPNINAIEAMRAANLDWSVSKTLIYANPDNEKNGFFPLDGYVGVKRDDNNAILGITTPRYVPFQNAEGFEQFQRVLDTGMAKIETAGSLKGGRIVWALARIQSDDLVVDAGDLIRPFVLLSFGHDGKRGIRFGFTPVRVVCWNTLSAAEQNDNSKLIRVSHKGDVQGSVQMLVNALDLSVQEFRAKVSDYRKMLDTNINADDLRAYVRVTLGLVEKDDNKRSKNIIDKVVGLAHNGIGNAPYANTVYGAYNAITEWLSHHAARNADNRLNSLWFGGNSQVLKAAHENAMKLVA